VDNHDIQAVLNYIVGLWNPKKDKFGEIHQKLLVNRIKGFRVSFDEAEAAIGEVYLTTKSFGGVCIEDIYKRLKGINESKFRAATVWKVEQPPAHVEHKSMREWMEWYTDPAWPGRMSSLSDVDRAYFEDWKRTGKIPPIVKSVGKDK